MVFLNALVLFLTGKRAADIVGRHGCVLNLLAVDLCSQLLKSVIVVLLRLLELSDLVGVCLWRFLKLGDQLRVRFDSLAATRDILLDSLAELAAIVRGADLVLGRFELFQRLGDLLKVVLNFKLLATDDLG